MHDITDFFSYSKQNEKKKQAQLESDLEKAKFKYSQTSHSVEDYILNMEKKRIQDLKAGYGLGCAYIIPMLNQYSFNTVSLLFNTYCCSTLGHCQ